jgi:hypothetical protein
VHERLAIANPVSAGHLAIAVQREPDILPWQNCRHACSNRAFANLQRASALHNRGVPGEEACASVMAFRGPGGSVPATIPRSRARTRGVCAVGAATKAPSLLPRMTVNWLRAVVGKD